MLDLYLVSQKHEFKDIQKVDYQLLHVTVIGQ